jgi:chromate reductase
MTIAMSTTITILGIAGNLRKGSSNRAALRAAQKLAPEGMRVEIFDLQGIPF